MGFALKYRPIRFSEVKGQDKSVIILQNMLKAGEIGKAFIFSGGRGTGKTTLARLYAKSINCEALTEKGQFIEPCNKCFSCMNIEKGISPDLMEIDAASTRGIDSIRELVWYVQFASDANFKVVLLDEAHMLTREAFNALLKTLEEPPEHVVFIFATTEYEKLPRTIQSRCQLLALKDISEADCLRILGRVIKGENIEIERDALVLLAQKSDGSARDAINVLEQLRFFAPDGITYDKLVEFDLETNLDIPFNIISSLKDKDLQQTLISLDSYFKNGGNAKQLLKDTLRLLRGVFIVKMCPINAQILLNSSTKQLRLFKMLESRWTENELKTAMLITLDFFKTFEYGLDERTFAELYILKLLGDG